MTTSADDVLAFWFAETLKSPAEIKEQHRRWFVRSDALDREIEARFGALPDAALQGRLADWTRDAESALALVVVLDQFPRNLYRGTARAFAYDAQALRQAESAIANGFDQALHPLQAAFLYMPFEHAEDLAAQRRAVELFTALARRAPEGYEDVMDGFREYAARHLVVIEQFGRFPHRNRVLGRVSTPAEAAYLASGGETFGVSAEPSR